jgi:hypothetical protein
MTTIIFYHICKKLLSFLCILKIIGPIKEISINSLPFKEKVENMENWIEMFISQQNSVNYKCQKAIEIIIANQGKGDLKNIRNEVGIGERSLESYFKNKCGMSGNDSNPQYF